MPHLCTKEVCGIPLLGVFVADLADRLADEFPSRRFVSDMEFPVVTQSLKPGVKPCCDGSVAVITDEKL